MFAGERSIVEPRVMQLLVALHRAEGAVVSKDDLAALCWEGRIVGEDAINRVVSRLRRVAEKQAGGQFRVETITKVGYRLLSRRTKAVEPLDGYSAPMRQQPPCGASGRAPARHGGVRRRGHRRPAESASELLRRIRCQSALMLRRR